MGINHPTVDVTDESNDEETEEDVCPICGQEYVSTYTERPLSGYAIKPRADAIFCKASRLGGERTVYVHLE